MSKRDWDFKDPQPPVRGAFMFPTVNGSGRPVSYIREDVYNEAIEALRRVKDSGAFIGAIPMSMVDSALAQAEDENG